MTTRSIGARIPRNEDPRLLQGLGCFVDDVNPPGALHAASLRSPHAHARIARIDATAARRVPGVHLVLTAADLGELNQPAPLLIPHPTLTHGRTQRPLAVDEVRYVGEVVAFVVADSRYIAEDAQGLIEVDYEPLPVVTDLRSALSPGTPRVHADVPDNRAARFRQTVGDAEAALARAPRVLRERLTIERSCGSPIEARGVVAEWDARRRVLRVWDSTQAPLPIKNGLAGLFGLPEFNVEVVAPDVGGGFGTKIMLFYPEEILVPHAAITLGRPVKWTEDRREHLIAANQERGQLHDVEVGFDETGRILALSDHFVHDAGAYTPYGIVVPIITSTQLPGPYRLSNYTVEFEVAYTNKAAVSPYRGAGRPHGAFVMERTIGLIAHELGLGCYVEGTGIGPYEGAHVRVEPSGKVLVATGLTTQGQGHGTTFAQIAADAIGCSPADVSVVTGDTTKFNWGAGTYASRGLVTSGNAIHRAAMGVREKVLRLAASLLEVSPHDLELADGRVRVKGVPGKELTLGALATVANPIRYAYGKGAAEAALRLVKPREGAVLREDEEPGLEARGYYAPPHATFASGCHAAIVEVDIDTGNLTILKYVVQHDCGTLVNPMIVEGQIRGGVAQGVGGAFYERIVYDDTGQPLTTTFMDFLMPTALEVPEIEIGHIETPSPLNALGIKGVGEAGAIPVPALVAEAIDDALAPLGVRVREMPLDPDRLRRLIENARRGHSS